MAAVTAIEVLDRLPLGCKNNVPQGRLLTPLPLPPLRPPPLPPQRSAYIFRSQPPTKVSKSLTPAGTWRGTPLESVPLLTLVQ